MNKPKNNTLKDIKGGKLLNSVNKIAIPYMGSKRGIAKDIVDYIIQSNPNAKYFNDLFGGGGAISFEALSRKKFEKVVYNELNTGVFELLKKIRYEGVTSEFYVWITREEFTTHKNDDTWHGGLLKTCWSFGNNQRDYIYSKKKESAKKALFEMAMSIKNSSYHEKRIKFQQMLRNGKISVVEEDMWENFNSDVKDRNILEHMANINALEQVAKSVDFKKLKITNKSSFVTKKNHL